jgi:hypothetical protein
VVADVVIVFYDEDRLPGSAARRPLVMVAEDGGRPSPWFSPMRTPSRLWFVAS